MAKLINDEADDSSCSADEISDAESADPTLGGFIVDTDEEEEEEEEEEAGGPASPETNPSPQQDTQVTNTTAVAIQAVEVVGAEVGRRRGVVEGFSLSEFAFPASAGR